MIYFDNAATTKPSKNALLTAAKFNDEEFFNPSALYHGGLSNAKEIKTAKESILSNLGAVDKEVIFTSCGTESDNTAIFGAVKRGLFVTTKGEHSAVYKSFAEIKQKGENTALIDLNSDGTVNTDKLFDFIKNNPVSFVSVVHVNNETGGINDINYIAKEIKTINRKIIFHSDGVQAYGKIPYTLSKDVDLYSVSAHKINALKGTGALIKRKNLSVSPLIIGGGQEGGLRSGTENVFGIKVFEYAGKEHYKDLKKNFDNALTIKNTLKNMLNPKYFKIISGEKSSPYILTVSAIGLRGEVVMHSLEKYGIVVGNGSACSSKNRFSRVIEACGYGNDVLDGIVRLSFSCDNTAEEGVFVAEKLNETVENLRRIMF